MSEIRNLTGNEIKILRNACEIATCYIIAESNNTTDLVLKGLLKSLADDYRDLRSKIDAIIVEQ